MKRLIKGAALLLLSLAAVLTMASCASGGKMITEAKLLCQYSGHTFTDGADYGINLKLYEAKDGEVKFVFEYGKHTETENTTGKLDGKYSISNNTISFEYKKADGDDEMAIGGYTGNKITVKFYIGSEMPSEDFVLYKTYAA